MDIDQTTHLCYKAINLYLSYRAMGKEAGVARDAAVKKIREGLEIPPVVAKVMPELSDPQRRVLDALRTLLEREGYSPSVREIGATVGLSSSSSVHAHLKSLKKKGFIDFGGGMRKIRTLI